MRLSDLLRRLALLALAILPPAAAAIYITAFAKDGVEVASALLGVAGALTLANLIQIAFLMRENRRLAARQDDTRRQALALARCMRDLNHRMAQVETEPDGSAPLAGPSTKRPVLQAARTPRMATPPVPAHDGRSNDLRIVTLPQRRLAGVELLAAHGGAAAFRKISGVDDLGERLRRAFDHIAQGHAGEAFVLVASTGPLSSEPKLIAELEQMAEASPAFCARLLLGISQKAIRRGGVEEAAVLARLARAGTRFMLTDVVDFSLDPDALAACNITDVAISAQLLLEREDEARILTAKLRAGGISLIARAVSQPSQIDELVEIGVRLACGAALEAAQAEAHLMPWRAGPGRGMPLSARAEDSIRFRATG